MLDANQERELLKCKKCLNDEADRLGGLDYGDAKSYIHQMYVDIIRCVNEIEELEKSVYWEEEK